MSLPVAVSAADLLLTARAIASQQQPDGAIPWFAGEHCDPWDHVEAAMALTTMGLTEAARRAYRWSAESQRRDGSWPMRTQDGVVTAAETDTNQCAYLAVGVWHHFLVTSDERFLAQMWPAVSAAIHFVVSLQGIGGEIPWAVGVDGRPTEFALLAGNCSIYLALRCASAIAERLDRMEPEWELACARLGHALRRHPEAFADKSRYSMDWYYPMLCGVMRGTHATGRFGARWSDFVEAGWGIRCVDDQPWVTGAETCELVVALQACGHTDSARALFADMQHLRHDDGSYWTGYVLGDEAIWPFERTTWTAGAVVLAFDALAAHSPAHGLFSGAGLREHPSWTGGHCDCSPALEPVSRR